MPIDRILYNATIATNGIPSFVEAIAIEDAKISATGTSDDILCLQVATTQMIDCKGRTVIPGLNGAIVPGQLADLAVLSADYFSVPDEELKTIESVLTLVGGKVVHGAGELEKLAYPSPIRLSVHVGRARSDGAPVRSRFNGQSRD